jgi:hypothetical protein
MFFTRKELTEDAYVAVDLVESMRASLDPHARAGSASPRLGRNWDEMISRKSGYLSPIHSFTHSRPLQGIY